jgi:hypothetical protein
MPAYHRIISVPAEQITHGDIVLVYTHVDYNWKSFSQGGPSNNVVRDEVICRHRDPADGTIYIQTESHAEYIAASAHLQLDCLLTFGRNVKPVGKREE